MGKDRNNNLFKRIYNYLSNTKLHYYLHKTVSPKNTYLVALVVIGLFIIISYFSYAMFTVYEQRQRVLTMQAGSLSLNIASDSFGNNKTLSLDGGDMNVIDINVNNNSITKVKADLNYITDNNSMVVKYLDEAGSIMPDQNGNFKVNANSSKTATIVLYNNSNSSATITFNFDIGLENASLTGENIVITQTTDDPYKVINLNNNLANEIYSDNSVIKSLKSVPNGFDSNKETDGLYRYTDEEGTYTYFFRGIDVDNYVTFAGSTWRILRIHSDGTVKLIKEDALNFVSDKVSIDENTYKQVKYNNSSSSDDDSKYVGSNVKAYVDEWYSSEMNSYDNKIITNAYCSDRTEKDSPNSYGIYNREIYDDWDGEGEPTEEQEAAAIWKPSISCSSSDVVSTKAALITADEYVLSGGNSMGLSNYLVKNYYWWTMSPSDFSYDSCVYVVDSDANIFFKKTNQELAVRPVITLKANTTVASGDGKQATPYVIN